MADNETMESLRGLSDPSSTVSDALTVLRSFRKFLHTDGAAFSLVCASEHEDSGETGAAMAISSALFVLSKHGQDESVQSAALGALSDLAYEKKCVPYIFERRVDILVVAAKSMQVHRESVNVQREGCAVIANTLAASGTEEDSKGAESAVAVAGCAVISAVLSHPDEPATLESACAAIRRLLAEKAAAESIQEAEKGDSVVDAIAKCILANPDQHGLKMHGVGALLALLRCSAACEDGFFECDTDTGTPPPLSAITYTMKSNSDDMFVALEGLELMNLLASYGSDLAIGRIAEFGGIDAIVSAMRCHPYHFRAQEMGCVALGRLCLGGSLVRHHIIATKYAVESVVAALKRAGRGDRGQEKIRLQHSACRTLRNLSRQVADSDDSRAMGEMGVITALMETLRDHQNDPNLAELACAALCMLVCSHTHNAVLLRKEDDAQTLLYEISHRHPERCGRTGRATLKAI